MIGIGEIVVGGIETGVEDGDGAVLIPFVSVGHPGAVADPHDPGGQIHVGDPAAAGGLADRQEGKTLLGPWPLVLVGSMVRSLRRSRNVKRK